MLFLDHELEDSYHSGIILTLPVRRYFGTKGEGGGGWLSRPSPMIPKTVDSTNFNFGRPLGLSMRGKKPVELMI